VASRCGQVRGPQSQRPTAGKGVLNVLAAAPTGVPGQDDADLLPLSIEQEWFYLQRVRQPEWRYSIWTAFDIRGPLNTEAFLAAVRYVFDRQPGLRARLAFDDRGEPRQAIRPATDELPLTLQAVTCRSREQFEAYARAMAKRDMHDRWDPARDPMCRLRLLRHTDDEHILLATFDHLAYDHRTLMIFDRELWLAYARYCDNLPPKLESNSDLPGSVRRQRARYGRRASTVNSRYWAGRFAITPPVWQPSGFEYSLQAKPAEQEELHYVPGGDLVRDFKTACESLRCTPFEMCIAVFAALAFRITRQDRLGIFVPFDSRENEEKDVIGMFASVVPLVIDRRDGGAAAFLDQVKEEIFRALVHRHLPGAVDLTARDDQRARWQLEPRRSLSLNYIKAEVADAADVGIADLDIRRPRYASLPAAQSASLALMILDLGDRLHVDLFYGPETVDRIAAAALLSGFDAELRRIVGRTSRSGGLEPPGRYRADADLTALRDADGAVCLHVDVKQVAAALLSHDMVTAAEVRVEAAVDQGSEVVGYVHATGQVTDAELRDCCLSWPGATQYLVPPGRFVHAG
jgi:hypothetical protein